MTEAELLAQLRDVHVPTEVGWWPLAPGWWLVAVVGAVGLALAITWIRRQLVNRQFQLADAALQRIVDCYDRDGNARDLGIGLSRWLRQVVMLAHPRFGTAGLTKRQWLQLIDDLDGNNNFSEGPGKIFASEIYSAEPEFDADELIDLCHDWLKRVKPRLALPG